MMGRWWVPTADERRARYEMGLEGLGNSQHFQPLRFQITHRGWGEHNEKPGPGSWDRRWANVAKERRAIVNTDPLRWPGRGASKAFAEKRARNQVHAAKVR